MKRYGFSLWLVRLIFCVCVIVAYNIISNFGFILTWFAKIWQVLTPFVIGGVIAFLFFPLCKKIENMLILIKKPIILRRRRGISVFIVVIFMLILVLSAFLLLFPLLYNGILNFSRTVPASIDKFYLICRNFCKDNVFLTDVVDNIAENLNRSYGDAAKFLTSLNYKNYVGGIASFLLKIFNFFIGLIISIYILLERKTLKKALIRVANITLDDRKVRRIRRLVNKISKIIYIFIFGQILDALIIAYLIGLSLTLFRVSNSVVLSACYFILAIIPYFGSIVGVLFISLFSLFSGNINQFLIASVVSLFLQQLDSNLINPKIVGQAVGIKPLYVILGITLFGGIFGLWGLFLGPPLMAICLEVSEAFVKSKELKKQHSLIKSTNKDLNKYEIITKIKKSVTSLSKEDENS